MIRLAATILGAAFLAGAAGIDAQAPPRPDVEDFELTYFPSGRMVKAAAMGFDGLAADYAFLRGLQYYGEHRRTDGVYPHARHIFDVVVELDPRFRTPYVFGALVLAEDLRRPDLALELLNRGMEANPDDWELPFRAGFIAFAHQKDHLRAARWFERSMQREGAPGYVHRFAAYVYGRGGDTAASLRLWRELYESTEEPALREIAARYIRELTGEDR